MIRIEQLKFSINYSNEDIIKAAAKALFISEGEIKNVSIFRRSIDARKKDNIHYNISLNVELKNEKAFKLNPRKHKNVNIIKPVVFAPKPSGELELNKRPVIVGAGPAGLFCAYFLAKQGYKPLLIERGDCIEDRTKCVEEFWKSGKLDPESNVQFGAGGAGTYSDGKLNTLVKDTDGRIHAVLETFVENGAPEDILYDAKPHIGTDLLKPVITNITDKIKQFGGEIRYRTRLDGIISAEKEGNRLQKILLSTGEEIPCDILVLAVGHSARDTFKILYDEKLQMEPKAFAVGVRMEHPQRLINDIQYGEMSEKMPAAPYKLTNTTSKGRGVYSFCMCPGGYVVNASSEEGRLAVNGMSNHDRASGNANSAIIVSVNPEDFEYFGPVENKTLAGLEFQRALEERAFKEGHGKIPQQLYKDFVSNTKSDENSLFDSKTKGDTAFGNLRSILPEFVSESIIESMPVFNKYMPGFEREDAILSGVESRTSSPLRILRDEALESNIKGLYPCGEGAGFAGGIVSAAADGLRVYEAIIKKYKPTNLD